MTRTIIAAFVALGIVGTIAAPTFAHRPTQAPQPNNPVAIGEVWEKAQARSK